MLSSKDIITLNQTFHTGRVVNEGSLSYATAQTRRSRNWLRTAAVLTRALLVDHVFEDGNKRTAAAIITTLMDMHDINFVPEKITAAVITIAKQNIHNITNIERVISHARK